MPPVLPPKDNFVVQEETSEADEDPLAHFRIDRQQITYTVHQKGVSNASRGQVREAIFTPFTLDLPDDSMEVGRLDRPSSGVAVAVKEVRLHLGPDVERFYESFIDEVDLWTQLGNGHILEFLGFDFTSSSGYVDALIMCPWIENGSSIRYANERNLSTAERLHLALDAAEGLRFLHNHQPPICHGGIKAANVLIKSDGRATLSDFAWGRLLAGRFVEKGTGLRRGTIRWTSPERLEAGGTLSPASDVWAWGWLIWELLTNKTPFHSTNNLCSITYQIIALKLPACEAEGKVSEPPALARLLRLCWKQDPNSRLTIEECFDFLERIAQELEMQPSSDLEPATSIDVSKLPLTYSPVQRVMSPAGFTLIDSPARRNAEHGKRLPTPLPSPPPEVRSLKSTSPPRSKGHLRPPGGARAIAPFVPNSRKDLPPLPDPGSPTKTVESVFPDEHPQPYVFTLENSPPPLPTGRGGLITDLLPDTRMSVEAAPRTSTSSSRGASLPGLLGITKSLFRTSKRRQRVSSETPLADSYLSQDQDNGHSPWDTLDVAYMPRSKAHSPSSATNGSRSEISDGGSKFSNTPHDHIQARLQRIEATQARYLEEQREIKQYLSQMGQWLSQTPTFGTPAPALRLAGVSIPVPQAPPIASTTAAIPGSPSSSDAHSSVAGITSPHVKSNKDDRSWRSQSPEPQQPIYDRPKQYDSVNMTAMALRVGMGSDEFIPKAIGSTPRDSLLSQSNVGEDYVYQPSLNNDPPPLPPQVAEEPSSCRLMSEDEIEIPDRASEEVSLRIIKGTIITTGHVVAIKCLDYDEDSQLGSRDHLLNALSSWTERWASRTHPNLAKLAGTILLDNTPATVSEWYSGGNLTEYLSSNSYIDRTLVLNQIAEGLAHLHQHPTILHTNLKPSNVLVDGDGIIKLGDVGIPLFLTVASGVILHGKWESTRWTAPEILEGELYSTASDVYAFGCMALTVLKSKDPYGDIDDDIAVSKAIYRGELPASGDIYSELHPTWRACWSHSTSRRPTMQNILASVISW